MKVTIFILVLLLGCTIAAYQGVQPLASAKDKAVNWLDTQTSKITETKPTTTPATFDKYIIPPAGVIGNWKVGNLRTVKQWEGTGSKELSYRADKTPWVLNAGYKVTSQISSKFSVYVSKPTQISGVEQILYAQETRDGISCILVQEKGNFKINIESSGANWWVRIGTE